MYVYCNRSQKTTPCKEQLCTFCSLRTVTSSVIYYSTHTHTEKCNLFVKYHI